MGWQSFRDLMPLWRTLGTEVVRYDPQEARVTQSRLVRR
jgi:hypothetical protein